MRSIFMIITMLSFSYGGGFDVINDGEVVSTVEKKKESKKPFFKPFSINVDRGVNKDKHRIRFLKISIDTAITCYKKYASEKNFKKGVDNFFLCSQEEEERKQIGNKERGSSHKYKVICNSSILEPHNLIESLQ